MLQSSTSTQQNSNQKNLYQDSSYQSTNLVGINTNKQNEQTTPKKRLTQPIYCDIKNLNPGSTGVTVRARVGEIKCVINRPELYHNIKSIQIFEVHLADEKASVIFSARNDQVTGIKKDDFIILHNAKVDMVKNCVFLAIDRWGLITTYRPDEIEKSKYFGNKKTTLADTENLGWDNNVSKEEYELVLI